MNKTLNESLSSNQRASLLEDVFKELNALYEDDNNPAVEKPGEKETSKAAATVQKLASIADKVEVPEKSVKLEGKADQIYDKMIELLKQAKLPQAVEMLEIISQDDKLKLLLQHGFAGGSNEEGKLGVTMGKGSFKVTELMPTQAEIGISNSLDNLVSGTFATKDKEGNPATGTVDYKGYFSGTAKLPKPFVYIGKGGNYIIDGHHRWSQAYCMNPNISLECTTISTDTPLSDEAILKNFQAAIAADPKRTGLGRKEAGFANLFGASKDTLKKTVDGMSEEIATKIVEAAPAEVLEAAVKEVPDMAGSENQKKAKALLVSNALKLASTPVSGKPKRILMPQTDDSTFSIVDGAIAGI
jgi:hypothetical protein